jgi:hypothetical protein
MSENLERKELYWESGNLQLVTYWKGGLLHRLDGPAVIHHGNDHLGENASLIEILDSLFLVEFWTYGRQCFSFWGFFDQSSLEVQKVLLRNWIHHVREV